MKDCVGREQPVYLREIRTQPSQPEGPIQSTVLRICRVKERVVNKDISLRLAGQELIDHGLQIVPVRGGRNRSAVWPAFGAVVGSKHERKNQLATLFGLQGTCCFDGLLKIRSAVCRRPPINRGVSAVSLV